MLVAHWVKKRYNENRMGNEEWTQAIIHRMKTSKGKTHHTKLKDEPRTPPPKNSGLNQSAREGYVIPVSNKIPAVLIIVKHRKILVYDVRKNKVYIQGKLSSIEYISLNLFFYQSVTCKRDNNVSWTIHHIHASSTSAPHPLHRTNPIWWSLCNVLILDNMCLLRCWWSQCQIYNRYI